MIITIIGSVGNAVIMEKVKSFFEHDLKATVHTPFDNGLQSKPLMAIQERAIANIEESDLVVVVPKVIEYYSHGSTNAKFEFGESTSYEISIARSYGKKVLIWPDASRIGTISLADEIASLANEEKVGGQ